MIPTWVIASASRCRCPWPCAGFPRLRGSRDADVTLLRTARLRSKCRLRASKFFPDNCAAGRALARVWLPFVNALLLLTDRPFPKVQSRDLFERQHNSDQRGRLLDTEPWPRPICRVFPKRRHNYGGLAQTLAPAGLRLRIPPQPGRRGPIAPAGTHTPSGILRCSVQSSAPFHNECTPRPDFPCQSEWSRDLHVLSRNRDLTG